MQWPPASIQEKHMRCYLVSFFWECNSWNRQPHFRFQMHLHAIHYWAALLLGVNCNSTDDRNSRADRGRSQYSTKQKVQRSGQTSTYVLFHELTAKFSLVYLSAREIRSCEGHQACSWTEATLELRPWNHQVLRVLNRLSQMYTWLSTTIRTRQVARSSSCTDWHLFGSAHFSS